MSSESNVTAMAVIAVRSTPMTPNNKRKIDLTMSEGASMKRSLLFTSSAQRTGGMSSPIKVSPSHSLAPRLLFPQGTATPVEEYAFVIGSNMRRQLESTHVQNKPWQTKRILLPSDSKPLTHWQGGFNEDSTSKLLFTIFPDPKEITCGATYINFRLAVLPEPPFPLTVGGLCVTISNSDCTRGKQRLFPYTNRGNCNISIRPDLDIREGVLTQQTMTTLSTEYVKALQDLAPSVVPKEILYTYEPWVYVFLPNEFDYSSNLKTRLPGKLGRKLVSYLREEELHRPKWTDLKAKRYIEPLPHLGVVDDTAYQVLRPGVVLHSTKLRDHAHPHRLTTTSGVLITNPANDVFMIGASHGIGNDESVFQEMPDGETRLIGKAVQEISFTDVAVIQLEKGVEFVNEPFENSVGVVPKFKRLLGEVENDELKPLDTLFLNSPYTGNMEGMFVASSFRPETTGRRPHRTEVGIEFITYQWFYTGQVEESGWKELPDGMCGSAIWNDEGVITGFFQYHISLGALSGLAVSVSAREVVKTGWRLFKSEVQD